MRVIKIFLVFTAIALFLLGLTGCGAVRQAQQAASGIAHLVEQVGAAIVWCISHFWVLLAVVVLGFIAVTMGPALLRRLPWWLALVLGGGILLWLAGQSGIIGKVFSGIVAAMGGVVNTILAMAGPVFILAIVLFGLWVMIGRPGRRH